jgi:spore coat protein U-like protein
MRTRAFQRRVQGSDGASTVCGGSLLFLLALILIVGGAAPAAAMDFGFVRVTATSIDFGQAYAGATFTGNSTVTVMAPAGLNFRVALGGGFHYSAGFRHLKQNDGAETIPYNLYQDAGCTLAFGDAGLGDTFPAGSGVAVSGIGRDVLITIYGRMTVPSRAPPGLYLDSIVIAVTY